MECFDIVNENDVVIGQASQQKCCSNSQLIHRAIHFTLIDPAKKKIFIVQRTFDEKLDFGKWGFISKHLLAGEDYPTGVFRAVEQELGFFSKGGCGEYAHHIFSHECRREFARFFVVYWQGEVIKPNRKKIIAYRWLTLDELKTEKADFSTMTKYWIEKVNWNSLKGWIG